MFTGDLVDWDNKELHKGFGVAASRTKEAINKYISEHTENDIPSTMLICGHSRGAAIANILGAYYEDRDDIVSYTNTFASPLCTVVNKSYKSIWW